MSIKTLQSVVQEPYYPLDLGGLKRRSMTQPELTSMISSLQAQNFFLTYFARGFCNIKKDSFKSLRGVFPLFPKRYAFVVFLPAVSRLAKNHPQDQFAATNYQHHWRFPCLAPCCSPSGWRLFCDTTNVGKKLSLGWSGGQDSMVFLGKKACEFESESC